MERDQGAKGKREKWGKKKWCVPAKRISSGKKKISQLLRPEMAAAIIKKTKTLTATEVMRIFEEREKLLANNPEHVVHLEPLHITVDERGSVLLTHEEKKKLAFNGRFVRLYWFPDTNVIQPPWVRSNIHDGCVVNLSGGSQAHAGGTAAIALSAK